MVYRIVALVLLILMLPLFLIIAIAVKIDSNGSVIFKQKRIGEEGRLFTIYKFRTMVDGTPDLPSAMIGESDPRITNVGKFIRRYSLDELTQIFNILLGNMNFIGPRPALYNQYELIKLREQAGVHNIKPGITGWAQVNGRDMITEKMKVDLDTYYLQNKSILLDSKILFMTILKSMVGEGIYNSNCEK